MAVEPAQGALSLRFNSIEEAKEAYSELWNKHQELLESERNYRQIVDASLPGVWAIDNEGRTTFANQRMADMLGLSLDELMNSAMWDFVDDQGRHTARNNLQRRKQGVEEVHYFRFRKKDGGDLDAQLATSPLHDAEGQVIGAVAFITHVGNAKKAVDSEDPGTEQVRLRQRLEAVGTLAGGVAHEINNPIQGICNYAELIMGQAEPGSDMADFASQILTETERVANIIRSLLAFARKGGGPMRKVQVSKLINDALYLVRNLLRSDSIELTIDVQENLPEVRVRERQIQQVLINLITNAREALVARTEQSPSDEEAVPISRTQDRNVKIHAVLEQKTQRHFIKITVEDDGDGISEEALERIFDPFYSARGRAQGRGLGLFISHGIAAEHQGMLSAESAPGEPTRFHLRLPVQDSENQPPLQDE